MPVIYAEWICRKCGGLHRVIFQLDIATPAYYHKKRVFELEDVKIEDVAFNIKEKISKAKPRSTVYVKAETAVSTAIDVLRAYMKEYYTIEEKTLKVDICL
jgi:hypothetical protein